MANLLETSTYVTKYRPRTLAQVVGQSAAKTAITSMLARERVSPVVTITGGSGLGKTTLARILADLVNAHGVASAAAPREKPVEINCGPNGGIDDIRKLIDEIRYKPRTGRFRVVILDEFHLATKAAVNALLKPLEDVPPHVIFIICSSEGGLVPYAVKRRGLTLQLHPVPDDDVVALCKRVVKKENLPKALNRAAGVVAKYARGVPAMALVLLEQLALQTDAADAKSVERLLKSVVAEVESEERRAWDVLGLLVAGRAAQLLRLLHRTYDRAAVVDDALRCAQAAAAHLVGAEKTATAAEFVARIKDPPAFGMRAVDDRQLFERLVAASDLLVDVSNYVAIHPMVRANNFVSAKLVAFAAGVNRRGAAS